MGKSDEYIDFKAYMRYLGKVTGEPADPDRLKRAVLARAEEHTELQTALSLLKKLSAAAAIVLVCALGAAGFGYASTAGNMQSGSSRLFRSFSRTGAKSPEKASRSDWT